MKIKKTEYKYKLLCPNKKCNYMIELDDLMTIHLDKVLKKCPVCKTRYKSANMHFNNKSKLTKKQRIELRKKILKKCTFQKKRPLIFMLSIYFYQKSRILFLKYLKNKPLFIPSRPL